MSALIASSGPSVSSGPQTKQLAGFFGGNEGISQAWMGISAHAARRACLERSICSATGHPATRDPRRRRGPSTSRSASSASSRQRRGALRSAHRQRDRFADLLGNRDRGLHPLSCDPGHTPVPKTGRERLLGARHARARRVVVFEWTLLEFQATGCGRGLRSPGVRFCVAAVYLLPLGGCGQARRSVMLRLFSRATHVVAKHRLPHMPNRAGTVVR
jgi:hypothetical protein